MLLRPISSLVLAVALILVVAANASAQAKRPTLLETTSWISEELSSAQVTLTGQGGNIDVRYTRVEFTGCKLYLVKKNYLPAQKYTLYNDFTVDLKTLQSVKAGENNGGTWAVYLDTYKNFPRRGSTTGDFSSSTPEMFRKLPIPVSDEVLANRLVRAFERIIELCGEPARATPF